MTKYIKYLFFLTIIILIHYSFSFSKQEKVDIKWMTWEEVQIAQRVKPKKVFVDVYTNWCAWCKRMDATTFQDNAVARYINENYYAVKFNAEDRNTIHFKGRDYKYVKNGRRGYNELASLLLEGQMSYPSTVYLDEDLNVLTAVGGYLEAKTIDPILSYFATDSHKKMKWSKYEIDYKSIL